jgi:dTDP-4-dehydrorhamnose reductase
MTAAAPAVLLLGAGGRLGRAWRDALAARGIAHRALERAACDVTSPDAVDRAIDGSWPVVVNCAALADVDRCERDPDLAEALNSQAPARLAERCRRAGALLVHYSTDYVYGADGRRSVPYQVGEPPAPAQAYGTSKARGEERVRAAGGEHLIVRTSWVYARWGGGFVRLAMERLRRDGELAANVEQIGCPTAADHLVDATRRLLAANVRGTVHVTDGGACSWYDVGVQVALRTGGRVRPCTTADLPAGAPRPRYSVLAVDATEASIGPMPGWRASLAAFLERGSSA